ncbi:MAG: large-conductance mechanosensitive channel protein MscL [Oscillospiraceae bacterium]|nr:large-conductance mechanosensitive channel protein MscL [Oscillospiraceae bacterium]
MKKMAKEFKEFVMRGNVVDMAIGVVIGAAFGAITTALVGSVITPLLAWIFGAPNTDALNITLRAADEAAGTEALVLGLGTFVGAIVNFILIALVLFLVVKGINKMKRPPEPAPEPAPAGPTTEELLGEIRDLLKEGK